MIKPKCYNSSLVVLALLALLNLVFQLSIPIAQAQGTTAFTYQGQLHDGGTNANGTYTMQFKLYDSSGGNNQIGSTITTSPTLANGLFTVNLDFGAGAFNGSARYLDITVTSGATTQTLSPRVQVLPTPYAQFAAVAATVTNGAIMNSQLAGNAVATTNIQNGAITTTQIATGAVTNANLTANAVNATNIASGQVVKSVNGLTDFVTVSPIPHIVLFHGNGTFVVPAGVTRIEVEMWGAGGNGGTGVDEEIDDGLGDGGTVEVWAGGGGGGAGAYAMNVFTVTPGSSFLVIAPAAPTGSGQPGGTASFGGVMSAGGGDGGGDGTIDYDDVIGINGAGGAGGTASGGLVNVSGGYGDSAGDAGGSWRGGAGQLANGASGNGPGRGGSGIGAGGSVNTANDAVVFVYY